MTDEINLNDVNNLNPIIPQVSQSVELNSASNVGDKIKTDITQKQIEAWNNKPEIKSAGIKAGKISTWNFWKILGIIGIICLIIFAGVASIYGYSIYQNGVVGNFICSNNFTSSCPADTNTNSCGACNLNSTCICPENKIYLNCS